MNFVNLGRSGLKASRLCLGCMSYGEPTRLPQPWSLDEHASGPFFRQALEAGINFFDTANVYSGGSSEEIAGPVSVHRQANPAIDDTLDYASTLLTGSFELRENEPDFSPPGPLPLLSRSEVLNTDMAASSTSRSSLPAG